uniref:F-box domain-containing protein n=1 Tax=Panagrellus redivivus TaxID=6233 RepID=A0A7E4ZYF0_PANRE
MALVSTSATEHVTVFNLLSLPYGVCRNLLDIMPLKDLYFLRKGSDAIKSLSAFRGDVVEELYLKTDTSELESPIVFVSFSEVMNRQFNTTPLKGLKVHMGPDIVPDVLFSKMENKHYRELCLLGNYSWKTVVAFLHAGVEYIGLYGHMDLPVKNVEEFFKTLICYKIQHVDIQTDNYEPSWLLTTERMCNNAVGITVKFASFDEQFYPEIIVTSDNAETRFVGYAFFDELEYLDDSDDDETDESDDEETDDEEMEESDDEKMEDVESFDDNNVKNDIMN